jgi:hypothetical protein
MKRFFLLWLFVFIKSGLIYSQGEIDKQKKLFYRNEKSFSFSLTSTGWGINGRFAKHLNAKNKSFYDLDFAILKHPQELRLTGVYASSGGNFVYGKKNIVFDFRFGMGKQREMFEKLDIGGVSIRNFYSIGPSLALLKPIYFEVSNDFVGFSYVKYNNSIINNKYFARASFFRGFSEIVPVPGAFIKLGLSFEYSNDDRTLHAIEAGGILEGFVTKLDMMDNNNNKQFFISLFVTYRFGKVYSPYEPIKKIKKREDYFY